MKVAALYVETGGVYYGLPDVDPWDEARDARLYAGPWPVVAHPPKPLDWTKAASDVIVSGFTHQPKGAPRQAGRSAPNAARFPRRAARHGPQRRKGGRVTDPATAGWIVAGLALVVTLVTIVLACEAE